MTRCDYYIDIQNEVLRFWVNHSKIVLNLEVKIIELSG